MNILVSIYFLSLLSFSLAAPRNSIPIAKAHGRPVPGSYIVTLKPGADKAAHLVWAEQHKLKNPGHCHITHPAWNSNVLHGFAGNFSEAALAALASNPEVESIEENAVVRTQATMKTQAAAGWSLNRLSHKVRPPKGSSEWSLSYKYSYDSRAGEGVDIYFLDTGINVAHKDFGGRAKWGTTFSGYPEADGAGHGTHCAGIAISTTFGVAKKATAIAVKVLDDTGSGTMSDVISGLSWVLTQVKTTKRPSVINLSLGGGVSDALDSAVTNAVTQGVHVAVAAGNDAVDAKDSSPARAPKAVTVGATNISDARAYFSNYGSSVAVFAPGDTITSTWIGSTTATQVLSGTSMAAPHIAGLMAYIISLNGRLTPAQMTAKIQSLGQDKMLSNIPSGTRNELAYNGDRL